MLSKEYASQLYQYGIDKVYLFDYLNFFKNDDSVKNWMESQKIKLFSVSYI